jgi:hypothetical protein
MVLLDGKMALPITLKDMIKDYRVAASLQLGEQLRQGVRFFSGQFNQIG